DRSAVLKRPVGGLQVFDPPRAAIEDQAGVAAGNPPVGQLQVVLFGAPDGVLGLGAQGKTADPAVLLLNLQPGLPPARLGLAHGRVETGLSLQAGNCAPHPPRPPPRPPSPP